jgi:hypothetical protein
MMTESNEIVAAVLKGGQAQSNIRFAESDEIVAENMEEWPKVMKGGRK